MNDELIIELGTRHPMPCAICGGVLKLKTGSYGPYYSCTTYKCKGTAKAHGDGRPAGNPGTEDVSFQRQLAHKYLELLKEQRRWIDDHVYMWLSHEVLNSRHIVHIGDLKTKELRIVIRAIQAELKA